MPHSDVLGQHTREATPHPGACPGRGRGELSGNRLQRARQLHQEGGRKLPGNCLPGKKGQDNENRASKEECMEKGRPSR